MSDTRTGENLRVRRTATREKGEETEMKQAEMGVGKGGRSEVQDQS